MMQDRGVLWRARLGKGSGGGGLCVLSNQGQTARRLDGWLNFVVMVVKSLSRMALCGWSRPWARRRRLSWALAVGARWSRCAEVVGVLQSCSAEVMYRHRRNAPVTAIALYGRESSEPSWSVVRGVLVSGVMADTMPMGSVDVGDLVIVTSGGSG